MEASNLSANSWSLFETSDKDSQAREKEINYHCMICMNCFLNTSYIKYAVTRVLKVLPRDVSLKLASFVQRIRCFLDWGDSVLV